MSQAKKRLAVLTGGGDCPGLNAVIRAVVKTALNNGYEIFGIENGFNGLVTGRMGLMFQVFCRGAEQFLEQLTATIPLNLQ